MSHSDLYKMRLPITEGGESTEERKAEQWEEAVEM